MRFCHDCFHCMGRGTELRQMSPFDVLCSVIVETANMAKYLHQVQNASDHSGNQTATRLWHLVARLKHIRIEPLRTFHFLCMCHVMCNSIQFKFPLNIVSVHQFPSVLSFCVDVQCGLSHKHPQVTTCSFFCGIFNKTRKVLMLWLFAIM
jgi:hypothetical protein